MSNEITAQNKLTAELDEALKVEVTSRHSYFQLKYFVINKEPTIQAKMWQCLREMKSRRDALLAIDLEIEESKDRAEMLNIQIQKAAKTGWTADADAEIEEMNKKEHQIKNRRLLRKKKATAESLIQLEEKRGWMEDEARFFLETFRNLEKVEKLKPFDDLDSQKQYWGSKLSEKINLNMLLQKPLDTEMIETILALPDDIPVKKQMVNRLNTIQTQLLEVKEEYKKKLSEAKKPISGAA